MSENEGRVNNDGRDIENRSDHAAWWFVGAYALIAAVWAGWLVWLVWG